MKKHLYRIIGSGLVMASLASYELAVGGESLSITAKDDSLAWHSEIADITRRYGNVWVIQNLPGSIEKPLTQLTAVRTEDCHSTGVPLRDLPAGGIYKWTDANGITHYRNYSVTDKPVDQTLVVEFPAIKDYFDLDIRVIEGHVNEQFTRAVQRLGTTIFDYYKSLIEPRWLQRAEVKLLVYRTERTYFERRDHFMRREVGEDVPGFFVPHRNQAMIWHQGDDKAALQIASHELTHVINQQLFGALPRWLNEGLAILFERTLEHGSTVLPQSPRLPGRRQAAASLLLNRVSLTELMSAQPGDWGPEKRPLYYQLSGDLMYFLLQPANRIFFRDLLNRLAMQKCQAFNVVEHIENHFSGGMAGLSKRFSQWVKS